MGTVAVQFLFITISLYLAVQTLHRRTFRDRVFYRICVGDTPSLIGHVILTHFRFQPPLVCVCVCVCVSVYLLSNQALSNTFGVLCMTGCWLFAKGPDTGM